MTTTQLKAVVLLGTLKKKQVLSNTQALCEVVCDVLSKQENVRSEIIRLRDYDIQPGTKTEIDGDDWPKIVAKMVKADIIIFATPIWWGIQSSLIQRIIERLDELNDELLETGKSEFANKVGGIIITGAEDGAEHIIGNILNFMSFNGFSIPPAPSVSWLGDATGETKESLKNKFRRGSVGSMIKTFARNEAFLARLLRDNPFPGSEKIKHRAGAIGYRQ
ncbi:MAG TPA: flavodoxin family protein [Gemmatimonadaceae bacterium]|jgi:multimeric flavodoxin WrbA|nr:flavodoxin family protein [Gemmatimonadaceae bacterium]